MDLWDELKRGAQSIVDEGSKFGKMAKLRSQVRGLEAELGDKIYDLGTRSLELHRRNELHHFELDELFAEIQAMQRELREREAEIEAMAGREPNAAASGACPDCGQKVVEGDRFCRGCGYRLKG
ncbi:MAG: zinc-ribbon domain-containing protein [Armatimonadetes bacterium]|nr:zinc-ribbon domain-containing protein [Armatimonadota bacterium]